MSKLSKVQIKQHQKACDLLEKENLTFDEKLFVYENFQEGAEFENSSRGAFFTPAGLANDFCIEMSGRKIIDLCAGIGILSFSYYHRYYDHRYHGNNPEITCIEINRTYVEIGKKLFPEANWIWADVAEIAELKETRSLVHFDCAISNPPFGNKVKIDNVPYYSGNESEYQIIDIASTLADYGVFIIPQTSAPFSYSGVPYFFERSSQKHEKFKKTTGLILEPNCGIDTTMYAKDWRGVSPACEIVCCEFDQVIRPQGFIKNQKYNNPAQQALFQVA